MLRQKWTVDQLITMLHDENPDVRIEAAVALRKFKDKRAVEPCIDMLRGEENLFVRGDIAETLRVLGDVRIVKPFIRALKEDSHWYVRAIALKVLDTFGDASVEEHFVKALHDPDLAIQGRAADILQKRGWTPEDNFEKAIYFAAKQDWEMVMTLGAQAVAPLLILQNAHNRESRKKAIMSLKTICPSIERIVFGTGQLSAFNLYTTLCNIDVSELTLPLSALKNINIFSETYDFWQVERFITYALDFIGQKHLKEQVEVHIYGDPEKLHPNLRNTFKNLCKRIEEHKTG